VNDDAADETKPDSLAVYVARCMMADRGYRPGVVPEANALADAGDVVLTYSDGMTFSIACILDRDADRGAERDRGVPFAHTVEELRQIGKACLQYTGRMNGAKLPVAIHILDVGESAPSEERRAALRGLFLRPGFQKVSVVAWMLDGSRGEVWSNGAFRGLFQGRRFFERWLRSPRRTPAELEAVADRGSTHFAQIPMATAGIAAVLTVLFGAEVLLGLDGPSLSPTVPTLIAAGGVARWLVFEDHEYFRMFTAPLLHGGVIHLVLNLVAMFMGGVFLEALLGRTWLVALFFLGALGGSIGSVLLNDAHVVSVGASGAIMGLLAAASVTAFRLPAGPTRSQVLQGLARMLLPSLIPIGIHGDGGIDFGAHLGGAITGAVAALVLFHSWRPDQEPPRRKLARAVVVAGALLSAIGFGSVSRAYPRAVESAEWARLLLRNEDLPRDEAGWDAHLDDFIAKYPRDPRVIMNHAYRLEKEQKWKEAEPLLREAIAEQPMIDTIFGANSKLETLIRSMLVENLIRQGRRDEAVEIARPACQRGEGGTVPPLLASFGVCK